MKKVIQFFEPLVKYNIQHPFWVLAVTIGLSVVASFFALRLQVDTDLANLLPDSNPNVQALEKLKEVAGGETEMKVGIKSPDFQANVDFARQLADSSLKLYYPRLDINYFNRAELRRETGVLKDNALYLATTSELQDIIDFLQAEIDEAREEANPFFVDFSADFEDEESESADEDSSQIDQFQQSYDNLIPSEYQTNEDSTLVILTLYPTGSQNDIRYLEDMFEEYQDLIDSLEPASFHPEMEVRFGGRLKRHLTEFESIMNDVFNSFSLGISSVILLVMIYFGGKKYINYRRGSGEDRSHGIFQHIIRMPVPIIIIGLPLLISLTWTFGITYAVLGVLNTMTSVLFVILFGLGIDYGIHFYARYIEIRSSGLSVEQSVIASYRKTGIAILVSAVTTASALFILLVADFRGFSEFGFIAGTGIILALFCMLYVLPALLVIFDRWNWILLVERAEDKTPKPVIRRFPFSRTIVVFGLVVSAVVLSFSGNLRFEYDFGVLEPEYEEYDEFRNFVKAADEDTRRNPAYIITDNTEDVFRVLEKVRTKKEENPETLIDDVEALQERFPPTQEMAEEKLEYISRIRQLLQNDFIVNQDSETLDILRRGSQTRSPLDESRIPEYLKNRFMTKEGEIGRFVIVYPKAGLSDGLKSIAFKNEITDITLDDGTVYHAASTSIVAATMLDLMRKESPYMVTATFIVVFILILISFRSFRWTLIALIPLLVGLLWLFGILLIFGLKFNFYNLVVLPAILGIGCDNGVHLAHRFRDEGKKNMWEVLSSTGQHITIGSVTTMMGFAGLLFTNHPGLNSIGTMAVIGIGMTLITALTFLPSIVQVLEDRNMIHD
ncbi:efflux RND transporter permease subunit [Rhodohalobacter sulfatireducens]|uniref:MMPL family transporter n=1 Tax=Rhodohalobacter sulfatireducens TaxID=2911366 RepID=A0ABS9KJ63_9BACT|nr:MMPL family transporter [Rhodohalobacter sulfatireducens]MCG2590884.1 MMPL family transporter [Rhodohalobacter sulfatireducens]MDR9367125.1 MMPL family transporter [Balneolaceae bacterium]